MAWQSLSNFYYLISPTKGAHQARDFLSDLLQFVDIAPATLESFQAACKLPMSDFVDAMQVAAAMSCGADIIATRNIRDYARAPIKAATPATTDKPTNVAFQDRPLFREADRRHDEGFRPPRQCHRAAHPLLPRIHT